MMKYTLKLIICLAFMTVAAEGKAQYLTDLAGMPVREISYTNVQGTPYLYEAWLKGAVTTGGKTYNNIELRYDQVTETLMFKNAQGQPLNFSSRVDEFKLYVEGDEIIYRSGFKPSDNGTEKTFYQVITSGEPQLVKRTSKKVIEFKEYNSATGTKKFEEIQQYYLVKNGVPQRIKKDKKSILEVLGSHKADLESFIKSNGVNFKSDDDLIKLVTYYNTLQ